MKRISCIYVLLLIIFTALSVLTVTACSDNEQTGNHTKGLTYSLNKDELSYGCSGIGTATDTEIVIPSEYKGLPVTSIRQNAFNNCTEIVSVVIPDSVTTIGRAAFYNCTSLASITVPGSVTEIGDVAFENCTALENITLPEAIDSWGNNVFDNTAYFNDDNNYTDGVLYIGNYLVKAKKEISGSYEIRQNTRAILNYAFHSCYKLTGITIPDSLTTIGDTAFYNTALTEITIPKSVTAIKPSAFFYCTKLENVYWNAEDCTKIGYQAFSHCSSLKKVIFGDGVQTVPDEIFRECDSIKTVVIGNDVTDIGDDAFYKCTSITDLTLGNGIEKISGGAFWGCEKLNKITIPDSVVTIERSAFAYCSGLTEITIGSGVVTIGSDAFIDCKKVTKIYWNATECISTGPESNYMLTHFDGRCFSGCDNLNTVVVGSNVKHMPSYVFYGFSHLTRLEYDGTLEQWASVTKGTWWNVGSHFTVYCTDGTSWME